jgi:hypothetical protein
MKHRKAPLLLALALLILPQALMAEAQNKPNVTGTWKMNAEKSKFERGGPQAITIKFDQKDATLSEAMTITNQQGERTFNFTYSLDGKESSQKLESIDIKTTAKWEGEALQIDFKNDEQGFSFMRKITLSGDGKTMTIDVKQMNPNGSASDTLILDKQ